MFKKHTRIVAFIGTLGASATLIGMAATNTGAYFQDSQAGSVTGTSGHIKLYKANDYNLNFSGLMPGEYQTKDVAYQTDSNSPEDIWLTFDQSTAGYKAFTGGGSGQNDSGLGRYGHFEVKNNDGNTLFSSWNLRNQADETSGCADANGHGSNSPATSPSDTQNGFCGVPKAILIESNVPNGTSAKLSLVFGLTPKASGFQDTQWASVPFKVVATQHGVRPDAVGF